MTGTEFERKVAELYRILGYKVTVDVLIAGQQVDVLAEKSIPGLGLTRVAIECKYLATGKVGNSQVYDFGSFFKSTRSSGNIHRAVLVTNGGFTRQAKEAAKAIENLQLLSFSDLSEEIFSAVDGLEDFSSKYRDEGIYQSFINLNVSEDLNSESKNALDVLVKHGTSGTGIIVLLGDFGSGKTTIANKTRYEIAHQYLTHRSKRIPVFYKLRDFLNHNSFGDYVVDTFQKNFFFKASYEALQAKNELGIFCHIFDGFDEINSASTSEQRSEYFDTLLDLYNDNSSIILTSRPTYFSGVDEYQSKFADSRRRLVESLGPHHSLVNKNLHFVAKFTEHAEKIVAPSLQRVLHLKRLTKSDIDAVLKDFDDLFKEAISVGWEDVREFLYSIYDLGDLMTRPLLLQMVLDNVLSCNIDLHDKTKSYGPASLYELYTATSLARDYAKGATMQNLVSEQRQLFVQALAFYMLEHSKLNISHSELLEILASVRGELRIPENIGIDNLSTDLRTTTFLEFSDDGSFRFAHKSFMEFFAARHFVTHINDGAFRQNLTVSLPRDVVYFVSSYYRDFEKFKDDAHRANPGSPSIVAALERDRRYSSAFRANLLASMLGVGSLFKGIFVPKYPIDGVVAEREHFENYIFSGSTITKAQFHECQFEYCKFDYPSFVACNLWSGSFNTCNGMLAVIESSIERKAFDNCNLQIDFNKGVFLNAVVNSCSLSLRGTGRLLGCEFTSSVVNFALGDNTSSIFELLEISFFDCKISCAIGKRKLGDAKISEIKNDDSLLFTQCDLRGVFLDVDSLFSITEQLDRRTNTIIETFRPRGIFRECQGVVFVSKFVANKIASQLYDSFENVVIVPINAFKNKDRRHDRLQKEIVDRLRVISENLTDGEVYTQAFASCLIELCNYDMSEVAELDLTVTTK